MLHITENIYLDIDPFCFVLQEQFVTPEINDITRKPNKGAGETVYRNQSFHATHKDVVNGIINRGFRFAVDGDADRFFKTMSDVEQKFDDILKLKRR